MSPLHPLKIKLLQKQKTLTITFDSGESFTLPCNYLRAHSPAANGSKPEAMTENINITAIEPVGNYAVKLKFDDGHDTGIYSWETLYRLGREYVENPNVKIS